MNSRRMIALRSAKDGTCFCADPSRSTGQAGGIQCHRTHRTPAASRRFAGRDPVDGVEDGHDGRLDGVGRDAVPADGLAVVIHFQRDFSQSVVSQRGTADLIIAAAEFYPRDRLRGEKGRIDRTVPVADFLRELLVAVPQRQPRARLAARARGDLEGDKRPVLVAVGDRMQLLLDQRQDVALVNLLLLVRQLLELLEHHLELFAGQPIPHRLGAIRQRRRVHYACPAPGRSW